MINRGNDLEEEVMLMKVKNTQTSKVLETPKIKDAVVHEKSHPLAEKHSVPKKIVNADMPQQQFHRRLMK